jgi:FHS family L-fucose permease-like MFS transporter
MKSARLITVEASSERLRLAVLLGIFLLYGVANSINHLLIHQFMKVFTISRVTAGWLQPAYYFGYVSAAIPTAVLVRRWGTKLALQSGLAGLAFASALVVLAASSAHFFFLLPPIFLLAVSVSALESTASPYVLTSATGDRGAERLYLAQSLNSLGMVLGASLGTFAVFPPSEPLSGRNAVAEAHRASLPFAAFIAVSLVLLALSTRDRFPGAVSSRVGQAHSVWEPLRSSRFRLVLATGFVYMATQICTWSFLLQYLRAYAVASDRTAGFFYITTLLLFALGRLLQTYVFRNATSLRLLFAAAVLGWLCETFAIIYPGIVGGAALALTGLFLSVMYPLLFVVGVRPMGTQAQAAGSWMVCSLLAGGIAPLLMARIVQTIGSYAIGYIIPCAGFASIAAAAVLLRTRRSAALPVDQPEATGVLTSRVAHASDGK